MGGRGAESLRLGTPGGGSSGNRAWSQAPNIQQPETLKAALGTKGRPMGVYAAAEGANPYFDSTGTYREFTENCQRCVVAYEARRRGYKVVAQPTYEGDRQGAPAYVNPNTGVRNSYWMGSFRNARPQKVGKATAKATRDATEAKMREFGNGSRGILQVQWKDSYGGGGHVLNVENRRGRISYVDAQSGTRYKPSELFGAIKTGSTQLTRTDNLRFSERAKNAVELVNARR